MNIGCMKNVGYSFDWALTIFSPIYNAITDSFPKHADPFMGSHHDGRDEPGHLAETLTTDLIALARKMTCWIVRIRKLQIFRFFLTGTAMSGANEENYKNCYTDPPGLKFHQENPWGNKSQQLLLLSRTFVVLGLLLLLVVPICADQSSDQVSIGNTLLDQGSFSEAIASFDTAISLDRNNLQAWVNRGTALFLSGKPSEALLSFNSALEKDPAYIPALLEKGRVLLATGNPEEALSSYNQAIVVSPGNAVALEGKGDALIALGQGTDALIALADALVNDPGNTGLLTKMIAALEMATIPGWIGVAVVLILVAVGIFFLFRFRRYSRKGNYLSRKKSLENPAIIGKDDKNDPLKSHRSIPQINKEGKIKSKDAGKELYSTQKKSVFEKWFGGDKSVKKGSNPDLGSGQPNKISPHRSLEENLPDIELRTPIPRSITIENKNDPLNSHRSVPQIDEKVNKKTDDTGKRSFFRRKKSVAKNPSINKNVVGKGGDPDPQVSLEETLPDIELDTSLHLILTSDKTTYLMQGLEVVLSTRDDHYRGEGLKGILLFSAGDYEAAITEFNKELASDPDATGIMLLKVRAFMHLGKFQEAFNLDTRILKLCEGNYEAVVISAFLAEELGYLEYGLLASKKAISMRRNAVEVWVLMGKILRRMGNEKEAVQALQQALDLDENSEYIWNEYGTLLHSLGRYQEAAEVFEKIIRITGENSETRALIEACIKKSILQSNRDSQQESVSADEQKGIPKIPGIPFVNPSEGQ